MTWAAALDSALTVVRDVFPQAATYAYEGGGSDSITGVFDEAYEGADFDSDGLAVITTRPMFWAKLADFASGTPHVRDTITIGSRTLEVSSTQIDGAGGVRLYLVEG